MPILFDNEQANRKLFEKWGEPKVTATAGGYWRIDRREGNFTTAYWGKGLSWEYTRRKSRASKKSEYGKVRSLGKLAELNALVSMRITAEIPKQKIEEPA